MPVHHVWVLLTAPLAVHLTLDRLAGSLRKVIFLDPVCQEDEVMGKLVHSFCRRRGQGRNPTGSICPREGRERGPGRGATSTCGGLHGGRLRTGRRRPSSGPHACVAWVSSGARLTSAGSSAVALRLRRPPPESFEHARKAPAREGSWATRERRRRNNQSGASTSLFRPSHPKVALPVVRFCACAERSGARDWLSGREDAVSMET